MKTKWIAGLVTLLSVCVLSFCQETEDGELRKAGESRQELLQESLDAINGNL